MSDIIGFMKAFFRRVKGIQKYQWMLIVILCVAAFIRLYQSTQYIPFWNEQVDDLLAVRSIWHSISTGDVDNLSVKGQTGTYRWSYLTPGQENPIYHGIAYYYVLLPSAVLSRFDPYGVVLFLILVGVASIYLLFHAGMLLFGSVSIGLLAAFLGATSFWLSAYSRWIWTPSMIPFFSLLGLVSFLHVVQGKIRWWYVLAFSMSLGSQLHNSGYVPLLFFAAALFFYKPKLPKTVFEWIGVVVAGLIPLAPTIWNEVSGGFGLVRALSAVGYNASFNALSIGTGVLEFVKSAVGLTTMTQVYRDMFFGYITSHAWPIISVGLLVLAGVYTSGGEGRSAQRKSKKFGSIIMPFQSLIVAWWIMVFPVSIFVEYLYVDQVINEYSRMNNMVFTFPMFILCASYLCVLVWRRRVFLWRMIVIVSLYGYFCLNALTIHDFLWTYNERIWAYFDLKETAITVAQEAGEDPYDVVVYSYNEGTYESGRTYEILYFIEQYPARMPQTYNGSRFWGVNKDQELEGKPTKITFYVVEKDYLQSRELPRDAYRVGETRTYVVYALRK